MVFVESCQNLVQELQMFFMGVYQEIVNVEGMLRSTPSMSHWKLAGQPNSPMGDVIQRNWPLPGRVLAVSFCESLSNCICQNPEV